MHEHAAQGVVAKPTALIATAIDALGHANQPWNGALIGELCRVLDKQNSTDAGVEASARRAKVATENFSLFDAVIGEEAVRGLCVSPVLAGIGNALAHAVADLPDQLPEASPKAHIFESRFVDLALGPVDVAEDRRG